MTDVVSLCSNRKFRLMIVLCLVTGNFCKNCNYFRLHPPVAVSPESCMRSRTATPEATTSTLPQATTVSPAGTQCDASWILFEGMCYHFTVCSTKCSADSARTQCMALGGQLASSESEKQHGMLMDNIKDIHFWLGGNDRKTAGTWVWENGDGVENGWSNWATGEPGGSETGRCMYTDKNSKKWRDAKCSEKKRGYVCEKMPGDADRHG